MGEAKDIVINLASNGQNEITKSGSFEASDNQILTLTIQSDIEGGSVDLFLFLPDYQEQRITIGGVGETKTIVLSSGRWAYNCTGFLRAVKLRSLVQKIMSDAKERRPNVLVLC